MAKGHIPVEYLGASNPSIAIPGCGRLSFKPTDSYLDAEGNPRRLEWLYTDEQVRRLTSPPYNRPGQDPLFRVAEDILAGVQIADLEAKVKAIVGPMIEEAIAQALSAPKAVPKKALVRKAKSAA